MGRSHTTSRSGGRPRRTWVKRPTPTRRISMAMFVAPGTPPDVPHKLSRDAAERIASNWWVLLLSGAALAVAGVLIFSIDWTIREIATFIGALFVFQGVANALTTGLDA